MRPVPEDRPRDPTSQPPLLGDHQAVDPRRLAGALEAVAARTSPAEVTFTVPPLTAFRTTTARRARWAW